MGKFLKWVGIAVGLAVATIVVAVAGAMILLQNTVAPHEGDITVAGLRQDVAVYKDDHAIPHIEAANKADALRALGWLHASERSWQMEVLRMAGQGRLAEMFGEPALASDRFLRTLGIADAARASLEVLTPRTRALIDAYIEGVNAWLSRDTGALEPALPIEFIILGHTPEPWEAWQSVSLLKVMALTLDSNMGTEIGRLTLAGRGFSPREIEEYYPVSERNEDVPPLPNLARMYGFDAKPRQRDEAKASVEKTLFPHAEEPWTLALPASNNWAISPSRSKTGAAFLANDPHLGLTAPSTFYLAHLQWQEDGELRNLIGGTLPGVPLVLSGRNDHVAWGVTTTYLDAQDVFLEQLRPDEPTQYRTPDGFAQFESDEVTLKVSGGGDEMLTIRRTRHGPVLPQGYRRLGELLPAGHVAALSWTGLARDDTTFDGVMAMGDAATVGEFLEATKSIVSPMQSVAIADTSGNIALVAAGRAPQRDRANAIAGRAPAPGWIEEYEWQGYVTGGETPRIVNPESGAVASANANWLPDGAETHITHDWAEAFRQERVEQLYYRRGAALDLDAMIAGQGDTRSLGLLRLRDELLRVLPQGVQLDAEIVDALQEWDGRVSRNSPVPLILQAWLKHLLEAMLADDLGSDFELSERGGLTRILSMLRTTVERDWCNDLTTPKVERCGDIVLIAGQAALDELAETYGQDWRQWRFGEASMTFHEHRPFSEVGALARFFTIRAQMDGGKYTLLRNSNNYGKDEPYAGVHGSALRIIHDFSDFNNSLYILSTGQSGNVFSPHYDDQTPIWAEMGYLPMTTDAATYRPAAKGVMRMKAE